MPTFVRGTNLCTSPGGGPVPEIDLISPHRLHESDFARSISRNRCCEFDCVRSVCAREGSTKSSTRDRFQKIAVPQSMSTSRDIDFRKSMCQNRCRHRARSISENQCAKIVVDIAFFPGHFLVLFLSHLAFRILGEREQSHRKQIVGLR